MSDPSQYTEYHRYKEEFSKVLCQRTASDQKFFKHAIIIFIARLDGEHALQRYLICRILE